MASNQHHRKQGHLCYRRPMMVTELNIYQNNNSYYSCPRCRTTLDREFTAFCDRCGQRLNWAAHAKAIRVYLR